jgi:hypothetical protein
MCLKYWLDDEVKDHDHFNMYDSSKYTLSRPKSLRYDFYNVPQASIDIRASTRLEREARENKTR